MWQDVCSVLPGPRARQGGNTQRRNTAMSHTKVPLINEPEKEPEKASAPNGSKTLRFSVPARSSKAAQHERLFPAPNSPQVIQPLSATPAASRREKVRLAPHHSALDWERHKHEKDVKHIDPSCFPVRITKEELSKHTSPHDCWVALGGKIYNISSYLDYHPGGVGILVKNAGKDCTALFMKYHRWVNFERILDECFIGFMVR